MNRVSKSSLFKKYVLSYLVVFFIPLIAFLIIINSFYIGNLREELVATQENVLQQTSSLLDEQIMEMNSLGNRINHSRSFISQEINDLANHADFIELLELYQGSSRSLIEMFVVIDGNSTVFSSKGTMSMTAMLNIIRSFDIVDQNRLIDSLSSSENQLSVHTLDDINSENELSNKVVYYTMPLNGAADKRGNIVFVLDLNPLASNLNAITAETGTTFILDKLGNVVLAVGQTELISELDLDSLWNATEADQNIDLMETSYFPTVEENLMSQWKLVSLTENNQFFRPLNQVIFLVVILIIFAAGIGLLISIYFAMRNYRPIHHLASVLNQVDESINDEFSFISSHIDKTTTELELLNNLRDEQAPIIRNAALMYLIEGKLLNPQEIQHRLLAAEIEFPYHLFSVAILEISASPNDAKRLLNVESIASKLNSKEGQPKNTQIETMVPFLRNNRIILICNTAQDSLETWSQIEMFIREIIDEKHLSNISVLQMGIGTVYNDITKLNKSYIEASSAIDIILSETEPSKENYLTLHFKDINNMKEMANQTKAVQFLREETLILQQSIKQGHQETAIEIVEHFFDSLQAQGHYDMTAQTVTADLVNTVLKTTNELNIKVDLKAFREMKDFKDIKKIRAILIDLIQEMCEHIEEMKHVESENLEKQVVQYIYDHFASPDISLEEIASENDISISYVSKLVKEETGESFSIILQNLRMDKFKELLLTTKEPIKALVQEVGYYDVSNFTRKFRKENGITPGEYRKKNMQNKTMLS